jgi:hypothetical protein
VFGRMISPLSARDQRCYAKDFLLTIGVKGAS